MAEKTCSQCQRARDLAAFGKDARNRDGLKGICKSCENAKVRAWREANAGGRYQVHKEANRIRAQEYYQKNTAHCLKVGAEWRARNPEAKAEADRAYYARRDRERQNAMARRRRDANRELANAKNRAKAPKYAAAKAATVAHRRAQQLKATPPWANRLAIRAIYEQAKALEASTGIPMHVDHEVPLVHPLVCGLHVEHNLRVLPARANQSKSNRWTPTEAFPD